MATIRDKKTDGEWEVKRAFRLPSLATAMDAELVREELGKLPGVSAVSCDHAKRKVIVRYRITECDYQSVERALCDTGFAPASTWWAKFKSNWYQNLDLNGRENAAAPPPACCNKPPSKTKK